MFGSVAVVDTHCLSKCFAMQQCSIIVLVYTELSVNPRSER